MRKMNFDIPPSKHNPFIVPENYFAHFTTDMMQVIAQHSKSSNHSQLYIVKWIPWLGVACVVSLFVLFTHLSNATYAHRDSDFAQQNSTTVDQSADEAYDYLMLADNIAYYEN